MEAVGYRFSVRATGQQTDLSGKVYELKLAMFDDSGKLSGTECLLVTKSALQVLVHKLQEMGVVRKPA